MMKNLLIICGLLVLAGCSKTAEQSDSAAGTSQPGHVWQDQVQTLDKARQVEQTVLDAARARDQQLEKQQ